MTTPRTVYDRLGKGVALPFRRLGAGLATVEGSDIVRTQLFVVLETLCAGSQIMGELPYNQRLGSLVKLIRHKPTTSLSTEELAKLYVLEKVRYWISNIRIRSLDFEPDSENKRIVMTINWELLDRNNGRVIESGMQDTVTI